jgi:FkbM family methyltransferase
VTEHREVLDNRCVLRPAVTNRLRGAVRAPLRRLGFDLVRYHPSQAPATRRARLISERRVDVVLDVGANDGPFAKELRRAGFAGRIVSFEPGQASFAALEVACCSDPAWECHRVAIGSVDGEAELHVAGNLSSSSLLAMTERHVAGAPESRYVATERVRVRRLDDMRRDIVRPEDAVYLKIDVQGLELEVLRGAESLLDQVAVVESELSLAPLYEQGATFVEVVDHLDACGFHLVSLDPVFVDPRDGRLLQLDGIFTRSAA